MYFDPGSRLVCGAFLPLSDEEREELNKKYYCKNCTVEIESYEHSLHDQQCEECYKKTLWARIKKRDRVKIKYSSDSKVPKKLNGLWVTIEGFNNRNNPEFYCPYTNTRRVLKFSNFDMVD